MPFVSRTIIPALTACVIFIAVFFSACTDKIKSNIIAFAASDEGLRNSNIAINNANETVLAALNDKTTDPKTADKAKFWLPKAELIQKLSKDAYDYIESLRSDLKKEARLKINDGRESFKENDKVAVMRLFEKKEKGKELYEHLQNYKIEVLKIDPLIAKAFNNVLLITTMTFESSKDQEINFTKTFFDDIPAVAALAVLSKFQNNIKIIENKTTEFCNHQVASRGRHYQPQVGFAAINSSYIKANESLEIMAGIGSFSVPELPSIVIEGKNVPIGDDGVAHYKFKALDKPGKHIVSVEMSYTDFDGIKRTITKNIEYTVAAN